MTESRKQPSQQAQPQADAADFDTQLAEAKRQLQAHAGPPAGAGAFPGGRKIWGAILALVTSPEGMSLLKRFFEGLTGGGTTEQPTPQPPAPPPEPAS